jgi:hypothetical protein
VAEPPRGHRPEDHEDWCAFWVSDGVEWCDCPPAPVTEDSDCAHADRVEVTTLPDRDRRFLCPACGYEWMEARE